MSNIRILKVAQGLRPIQKGTRVYRTYPKLLIAGDWLNAAGFAIGEVAEIIVAENFIQIIKKGGNS